MIVLIPAYEPSESLLQVTRELLDMPEVVDVVIVDDGSGADYDEIFALTRIAGARVIRYDTNQGKGHALKVGFAEIETGHPGQLVVCADCDGQHVASDIRRVAQEAAQHTDAMVLGTRSFNGQVPVRSRFGNVVTAKIFQAVSGSSVGDTQTGLRAYDARLLGWLRTIPGERFDYELNLLLQAKSAGIGIKEVPIKTVYLNDNENSHFRPIRDSWLVYKPLFKFGGASIAGFLVDYVALLLGVGLTGNLFASAVLARLLSGATNYLLNRYVTFGQGTKSSLPKYLALAAGIFAANIGLLWLLQLVVPIWLAKLLTEAVLFGVSFWFQRRFVFAAKRDQSNRTLSLAGRP